MKQTMERILLVFKPLKITEVMEFSTNADYFPNNGKKTPCALASGMLFARVEILVRISEFPLFWDISIFCTKCS